MISLAQVDFAITNFNYFDVDFKRAYLDLFTGPLRLGEIEVEQEIRLLARQDVRSLSSPVPHFARTLAKVTYKSVSIWMT